MNLIKIFILSFVIQSSILSYTNDFQFIEKTLHEKGKSIQEADNMLELLKATGEYIKTAELIESVYLNN